MTETAPNHTTATTPVTDPQPAPPVSLEDKINIYRAFIDTAERTIELDNLNPYYDISLKKARLQILKSHKAFLFYKADIEDLPKLKQVFGDHHIDRICNLAAQAGVRYSLIDPFSYQKSNLEGFLNLLELAREYQVSNFVYASSSSVYGKNETYPFSTKDRVDTPVSLYGATKKANELMAHAYSHLFSIPCTGLRYFTVYGPWGRPDMALFLFTDAILKSKPIKVYNHGRMKRDFTYIDDIVQGTLAALDRPFPYEVFNLGNSKVVGLLEFIEVIEKGLGRKAKKEMLPMQPGDVPATSADIKRSKEMLGFNPKTSIEEGVGKFLTWYRKYYGI